MGCRLFDISPKGAVPVMKDLEKDKWLAGELIASPAETHSPVKSPERGLHVPQHVSDLASNGLTCVYLQWSLPRVSHALRVSAQCSAVERVDSGDIVDYLEDRFPEVPLGKQDAEPHV